MRDEGPHEQAEERTGSLSARPDCPVEDTMVIHKAMLPVAAQDPQDAGDRPDAGREGPAARSRAWAWCHLRWRNRETKGRMTAAKRVGSTGMAPLSWRRGLPVYPTTRFAAS